MTEVEGVPAYSFEVSLGRAVTERVSDRRLKLHRWLATRLKLAANPELPVAAGTSDLSFEDLSRKPGRIGEVLRPDVPVASDGIITVDLSTNTYDLLNERFLLWLGQALVALAKPARTVVVLVPGHPPAQTSLLWIALAELNEPDTEAGRVLVIDRLGEIRAFGAAVPAVTERLVDEIRKRQAALAGTAESRFSAKLLRRLGHFDMAKLSGEDQCGRFFFDCSAATEELADILEAKLRVRYSRRALSESKLVLCGVRSAWMSASAGMVAERLGIPSETLPRRVTSRHRAKLSDKRNILLFDVISSGATFDKIYSTLSGWGTPLGDHAFAALTTDRTRVKRLGLKVDVVEEVRQQTVPREDCPQCKAQIPFSSFELEEQHIMISAYDMWSMLLEVPWRAEPYWPKGKKKLDWIPDFEAVFEQFGDWIAYRYDEMLKHLGHTRDVVIVAPNERRVQRLLDRLRARFEERIVAVAIDRDVIDAVDNGDDTPDAVARAAEDAGRDVDDWRRQLLHLRSSRTPVLVIDEFNASGGSARAIVDVLRAFGVPVAAYLPFLDWHPGLDLQEVRVHALYEIPSPREH